MTRGAFFCRFAAAIDAFFARGARLIIAALFVDAAECVIRLGIDAHSTAKHFVARARIGIDALAIDALRTVAADFEPVTVVAYAAEGVIRLRVDAYPAAQDFFAGARLGALAIDASRAWFARAIIHTRSGNAAKRVVRLRIDAEPATEDVAGYGAIGRGHLANPIDTHRFGWARLVLVACCIRAAIHEIRLRVDAFIGTHDLALATCRGDALAIVTKLPLLTRFVRRTRRVETAIRGVRQRIDTPIETIDFLVATALVATRHTTCNRRTCGKA